MLPNEWFNFTPILLASKSRSYRESVTKQCASLVTFLFEKSILKINPLDDNGVIKRDLTILKDDLTEAGQYLFTSGAIYKWLEFTDNGGKIDNFKRLEKALFEFEKSQDS